MPSYRVYVDFATGFLLDNPLSATATTTNSSQYTLLPGLSGGQYLALVLDPNAVVGAPEIVYVTGYTPGTTYATIVRGCEGTTARQHNLSEVWVASALASDLGAPRATSTAPTTPDVGQLAFDAAVYNSLNVWTGTEWAAGGMPVGAVIAWTQPAAYPPGWLPMDGRAILRASYPALFGVIGTTYGVGDGSTTFNLPNATSLTIVGSNNLATTALPAGTTAKALGSTGGAETVALTLANLAAHSHTVIDPGHTHDIGAGTTAVVPWTSGTEYYISTALPSPLPVGGAIIVAEEGMHAAETGVTTATSGSGTAHQNLQPYLALTWLIRA